MRRPEEQSAWPPKVRRRSGARGGTARMWMRSTATLYRHWIVVGYYWRNSTSLLSTSRALPADPTCQRACGAPSWLISQKLGYNFILSAQR